MENNLYFKKHIKRPIRFVELWIIKGWKIKIYSISETSNKVDNNFILIAKKIVEQHISEISSKDQHYYSAFLTVHTAKLFNQIIFDWWARENELRHLVFKSEPNKPAVFNNITASGEAFCVWELKVIGFERDAWMEHVVLKNSSPSFENYYLSKLNTDE